MPDESRISIYQGNYVALRVVLTVDGIALDITGGTLFFTVKDNVEDLDEDAIIAKVVTTHTDPTHGITLLELEKEDTDVECKKGRYYDFKFVDSNGNPMTFDVGRFDVMRPVTRRSTVAT